MRTEKMDCSNKESPSPAHVQSATKSRYKNYFRTEEIDGIKHGICLLCDREKMTSKPIKMTKGNTSGLKDHLLRKHNKEYEKIIQSMPAAIPVLSKQQKTMDMYQSVQQKEIDWEKMHAIWLASKNLPLNFFDDEMTQKYFRMLNPDMKMPKRNSMHDIVINEAKKMKNKLKQILVENESKLSFNIDAWTAKNGNSYYGITVHFIDEKWMFRSVPLELVPSYGKHSGKEIATLFYTTLKEFCIEEKVQGITMDNASANTTFIEELGFLMKADNIKFNVKDRHFRCFAHILNLGVQDLLALLKVEFDENKIYEAADYSTEDEYEAIENKYEEIENKENSNVFSQSIAKVRLLCKKLKNSEKLRNRLKLFCDVENENFMRIPLDVKTRWNSTLAMLDSALNLKKSLWMLCNDQSFPELKKFCIQAEEWKYLEKIIVFLDYFKHISVILSSESKPTLPVVVVAINMLIDEIEKYTQEVDSKDDLTLNDEMLIKAFQAGRDKILKHYDRCNWIYCVALVLDPRHKIDCFDNSSWGKDLKDSSVSKFKHIFRDEYFISDSNVEEVEKSSECEPSAAKKLKVNRLDFSTIYKTKKNAVSWMEEIERYLKTPEPEVDVDILDWWKEHAKVLPNLSRMARDILGTLASSVSVERFFSIGGLVMSLKRTSLNNDSLRALTCLNGWVKSSLYTQICNPDF